MIKLKYYCLIIFFTLIVISCTDSLSPDPDLTLEQIYQNNSYKQFDNYISYWKSESIAISDEEMSAQPLAVKYIYQIFEDYYDPFNLNKYSRDGHYNPEVGNDFYNSVNNLIVQDNITYRVNDNSNEINSIQNFRPRVTFPSVQILYLRNNYQEEFNSFLNRNHLDIQARYNFIYSRMKVSPGHWSGWHILTHPEILNIDFNRNLDTAFVNFRIRYEGGKSIYVRTGEQWNLISSKLLWIE